MTPGLALTGKYCISIIGHITVNNKRDNRKIDNRKDLADMFYNVVFV